MPVDHLLRWAIQGVMALLLFSLYLLLSFFPFLFACFLSLFFIFIVFFLFESLVHTFQEDCLAWDFGPNKNTQAFFLLVMVYCKFTDLKMYQTSKCSYVRWMNTWIRLRCFHFFWKGDVSRTMIEPRESQQTNNVARAPSEDSYQPAHSPSLIRVFAGGSLDP